MPDSTALLAKATEHLPHVQAATTSVEQSAGLAMPQRVDKRWGFELIFINEAYCMKQLFIQEGKSTSMHFHIHKHETLLVGEGVLTLEYKDGKGSDHTVRLAPGAAWVIPPGFQHKLSAPEGPVRLYEASTYDDNRDSIRVYM